MTLVLSPQDVFDLCSDLFDALLSDDVCGFLLGCWPRCHVVVNARRAPWCDIASIGVEYPPFLHGVVQCLVLLGPVLVFVSLLGSVRPCSVIVLRIVLQYLVTYRL